MDPQTGDIEVLADFPQMTASYRPGQNRPPEPLVSYRLARLPDGLIVFSAEVNRGVPTTTFALSEGGSIVGQIPGFAHGYRDPARVLIKREHSDADHEYLWWQPRNGTSATAARVPAESEPDPTVPVVRPMPHHPVVTTDGGLVLVAPNYPEERIVHFSADGQPAGETRYGYVPDDQEAQRSILAVYADGAVLLKRQITVNGEKEWSLIIENTDGSETAIYSKAQLLDETGWRLSGNLFDYPHLQGIYPPVIDEDGNAHVPVVLATSGTGTQTYLVAFDRQGSRLWGTEFERIPGGRCLPGQKLAFGRLPVLCSQRVSNRFILLVP